MDQNTHDALNMDLSSELLPQEPAAAAPPMNVGQATAPVNEAQASPPPQPIPQTTTVEVPEPAAEQPAPAEKVTHHLPPRLDETQTEKNPSMLFAQKPQSIFKHALEEKDRENGFLTIFLGNQRSVIEANNNLIQVWLVYRASNGMFKDGEIDAAQLQAAETNWKEYIAEHYPKNSIEEMENFCVDLYQFIDIFRDDIKLRSKMVREEDTSNVTHRGMNGGDAILSSDVQGRSPGADTTGFSLAESMRRSSINATKDLYQFDILLRNSYAALTIKRPERLSMGSLVLAINNQVKGYVRQVNNPSPTLAYIAGIRCMWDYIARLTVASSVKDTQDFRQLANEITITDADQLAMGLVLATHTNGIQLDLRCLSSKCNWSMFGLADPTKLLQVRGTVTPEQAAVHANVYNGRRKYSREEMKKLRDETTYGMEENACRVYGNDGRRYFTIKAPTLTQAFETFDYFVSTINPRIQELRSNTLDPKVFESELTALLLSLTTAEYIHWISEYVVLPEPGTTGKPTVFTRPAVNNDEFNQGLMMILQDDPALGKELVKFVYNKTPFFTHTFTGVGHYECPKCATNSGEHDHHKLGYTPINAFMSFFTLTQLSLMSQVASANQVQQEALSD